MATFSSKTLAEMRAAVRNRIDFGDGFVGDSELTDIINDARHRLYVVMVDSNGSEFAYAESIVSVVPSVFEYDLPADFWRLVSVMTDDGVGMERPLRKGTEREIRQDQWNVVNSPWRYRIRGGNKIVFSPNSVVSGIRLRVGYIPELAQITDAGGVLDCWSPNGVDYVVNESCGTCLSKQQDPEADKYFARAARAKAEFMLESVSADDFGSERVSEVWW